MLPDDREPAAERHARSVWITRAGALTPLLLLALVTVALYGPSLRHGLSWDDFPFVTRSYTLTDVGRALVGPWSPVEAPYYRPVAILLFALRDWTIGPSPVALHALSLGGAVLVGGLFAAWLRALGVSAVTAAVATCGLLAHPVFATSAVLWITNQMHLAQLALVLGALLLPPERWPWLLVCQGLAMGLKEDGLLLGPLLALQWRLRGWRVSRGWWIGTIALTATYLSVRALAVPSRDVVFSVGALARGVRGSWLAGDLFPIWCGLPLVALVVLGARPRQAFLLALAVIGLWSLPLLLTTGGPTRTHLLVVGVVTLLALSAESAWRRAPELTLILVTVIGLESVVLTRAVVATHAPCHAQTRARDQGVLDWPVSSEVRQAVTAKLAQCRHDAASRRSP